MSKLGKSKSSKSLDTQAIDKAQCEDLKRRPSELSASAEDLFEMNGSLAEEFPPPAKFFLSSRQDKGAETPKTPIFSSSVDLPREFHTELIVDAKSNEEDGSVPELVDCDTCLSSDSNPSPLLLQHADRHDSRRKMNFAVGLQNEAERRRQNKWL